MKGEGCFLSLGSSEAKDSQIFSGPSPVAAAQPAPPHPAQLSPPRGPQPGRPRPSPRPEPRPGPGGAKFVQNLRKICAKNSQKNSQKFRKIVAFFLQKLMGFCKILRKPLFFAKFLQIFCKSFAKFLLPALGRLGPKMPPGTHGGLHRPLHHQPRVAQILHFLGSHRSRGSSCPQPSRSSPANPGTLQLPQTVAKPFQPSRSFHLQHIKTYSATQRSTTKSPRILAYAHFRLNDTSVPAKMMLLFIQLSLPLGPMPAGWRKFCQ